MKNILGLLFVTLFMGIVMCHNNDENPALKTTKYDVAYSIISERINKSKDAAYVDVLIQRRMSKQELIQIAYQERKKREQESVMIKAFYFSEEGRAYGIAGYLVDCETCEEKDPDGEKVTSLIRYREPDLPETINKLPANLYEKDIIARYYDEDYNKYALIAYTTPRKTKASLFIFEKDGTVERKLKPTINGVFNDIEYGSTYEVYEDRVKSVSSNGTINLVMPRIDVSEGK